MEAERKVGTPYVVTVMLTHNHYEDTRECLDSLLQVDYPDQQILVVDNASQDETPKRISTEFPQVNLIQNDQNLGVPAGYNVGILHALKGGADYIFMVNNDIVLSTDILTRLVAAAEADSAAGIVMPKMFYYGEENKVWSNGGWYRRFPPAIMLTHHDDAFDDRSRLIEFAPACGLLIHRRAFESAGLFDPGYFFNYEDWDFSKRVRAQGLHIWYAPQTHLWHKVSRSTLDSGSSFYWRTHGASTARYYRRHGKPAWLSLPVHAGYIILRDFIWKRRQRYFRDFWQGMLEGMKKPLGAYPRYQYSDS